jgi:lambda family phage portal protein
MLHVFKPLGAGQVRGVSWLAPILLTVNEFDQLQDALLVGAKVAAMHAGFVVDQNNLTGGVAFPEANGTDISLEPGVIRVLPAGTDIRFNSPTEAKDSISFAKLTLGQIAAGLGVPQYLLDGDLANANYSSLRAGLLPFRAKVEQFVYHTLIPQMLDPVFRRVITHEYLTDRLDLPDLAPALKAEWLTPRPMQVDPAKDLAALKDMLASGLTSRRQAVASLGWNVDQLDREIAADRDRETELGLRFPDLEGKAQ